MLNSIWTLLKFNISSEYRKYAQVAGLVLFSWIVCYLIYRVHANLEPTEFGFIFWIFLMIISVNICLRAESHHGSQEHILLYTMVDPVHVLLAKVLFNFFYLLILGVMFYLFFQLYFSATVPMYLDFFIVIASGAFALSSSMSFVSSISSYAGGQNTLMSVLSLPLLIPVILILKSLTDEIFLNENIEYVKYLTLFSISFITIALSLILFPVVWKQ